MSYTYAFIRLPDGFVPRPPLDLGRVALPVGSVAEVQAALRGLHPRIQWSTVGDFAYGTVGPRCTGEFTLPRALGDRISGFAFNGPAAWIAPICAGLDLHCWDPQIEEIWCPDGRRVCVRTD